MRPGRTKRRNSDPAGPQRERRQDGTAPPETQEVIGKFKNPPFGSDSSGFLFYKRFNCKACRFSRDSFAVCYLAEQRIKNRVYSWKCVFDEIHMVSMWSGWIHHVFASCSNYFLRTGIRIIYARSSMWLLVYNVMKRKWTSRSKWFRVWSWLN